MLTVVLAVVLTLAANSKMLKICQIEKLKCQELDQNESTSPLYTKIHLFSAEKRWFGVLVTL